MRCPYCGGDETRVVDSRPADNGAAVRRRRSCTSCDHRFTTYERISAVMVVKRDGRREMFDPDKVRIGVERALADRPVPRGSVEDLIARVHSFVQAAGVEVSSDQIGREVLDGLRDLDEVAYLRFASVYQDFAGAADFGRALAELEEA